LHRVLAPCACIKCCFVSPSIIVSILAPCACTVCLHQVLLCLSIHNCLHPCIVCSCYLLQTLLTEMAHIRDVRVRELTRLNQEISESTRDSPTHLTLAHKLNELVSECQQLDQLISMLLDY